MCTSFGGGKDVQEIEYCKVYSLPPMSRLLLKTFFSVFPVSHGLSLVSCVCISSLRHTKSRHSFGTMSIPDFDTNQCLFNASNTKGAVFMSPNEASATVQRWQIVPVNINQTHAYILRTRESGANGFMGTGYFANEGSEGMTRPSMFRGDVVDNNVYWNFGSWGDGMFYLTNTINGTYHLNKKNNGIMAMSRDIAVPQNGQRFSFDAVAKVDNEKYSSVNLIGISSTSAMSSTVSAIATATSTPALATSSLSSPTASADAQSNASSSGLSTVAKSGIGAAVGGVVLIALVALGLFFWRKRKQQFPQHVIPQETVYGVHSTRHEMYHGSATKYEMSSASVVEVPLNERPAELPGHVPRNATRCS
ncbi:hypothetical protein BDU57DRAFT_159420 [Ampelomyces quisqualis]|uniref:Ricin B lectin domain-containing protein n=1 Tax=Ampelomyces quisqualis TaxID=50730 RepID=A0A6A5QPI3_AMPQU|nr:hypothetical protein BDU57DRAFT_159420 [Ampelomyces quisqualis]